MLRYLAWNWCLHLARQAIGDLYGLLPSKQGCAYIPTPTYHGHPTSILWFSAHIHFLVSRLASARVQAVTVVKLSHVMLSAAGLAARKRLPRGNFNGRKAWITIAGKINFYDLWVKRTALHIISHTHEHCYTLLQINICVCHLYINYQQVCRCDAVDSSTTLQVETLHCCQA